MSPGELESDYLWWDVVFYFLFSIPFSSTKRHNRLDHRGEATEEPPGCFVV